MESIFLESGVLGACVLAGGGFIAWLVKYMLNENTRREERHSQEVAAIHKENKETICNLQASYKDEIKATQSVFIDSMNKIVEKMDVMDNRMIAVENSVEDLKSMLK